MMKHYLLLFLLVVSTSVFAQSRKERELVERTYLLSHTVFGTKDSLTLEDLFAKKATYGHSGGLIQTREEAIRGISHNTSSYADTAVSNIKWIIEDDAAIVRYLFRATEKAADGKLTNLNFTMMLVWIREKGKWRLMGRQAVKI
jgi:hypothetical protein